MSEAVFDFLQQSTANTSDYIKFRDGDKRHLRIVSKPVTGFELFVEGKPIRWEADAERPEHAVSDERPKKFAAFIVVEYDHDNETGHVKLWSFSQRTIIDQMAMLFKDDHWSAFELIITRVGKGLETKYNVTGVQSDMEDNLVAFATKSDDYVKLTNLFTGDTPFLQELPELSIAKKKGKRDDLPF
tara:strand:+ start:5175 stop:5732 length:558 start_codon:yes stop_codon:yes gene_type:complete